MQNHGFYIVFHEKKSNNSHFFVVQQHAIHLFNGFLGIFAVLEMDEAIPFWISKIIDRYLTREDVPKSTEGVVERLIIDAPVQVLDEDVSYT